MERGPHSRKRSYPWSLRYWIAFENSTVARECLAQYAGSVVSAAVMGRPVTVETKGFSGGRNWILAMASRNGSTIGSIIAEWKACEVCRWRQTMPSVFELLLELDDLAFRP